MSLKRILAHTLMAISIITATNALADRPVTKDGVTTIHLDEYNGYFSAQETLVDLKPGEYEFIITNKVDKIVGFWLQDAETHEFLDKFPLTPGQTRTTRVKVGENGFRYRCPINPTPWYDVAVSK